MTLIDTIKDHASKAVSVTALALMMLTNAPGQANANEKGPAPTEQSVKAKKIANSIEQLTKEERAELFKQLVRLNAPEDMLLQCMDFFPGVPVTKDGKFDVEKARQWGEMLPKYIEMQKSEGPVDKTYKAWLDEAGIKAYSIDENGEVKLWEGPALDAYLVANRVEQYTPDVMVQYLSTRYNEEVKREISYVKGKLFREAVRSGAPQEELVKYITFPDGIPVTRDGQYDEAKSEKWQKMLTPIIDKYKEIQRLHNWDALPGVVKDFVDFRKAITGKENPDVELSQLEKYSSDYLSFTHSGYERYVQECVAQEKAYQAKSSKQDVKPAQPPKAPKGNDGR